MPIADYPFRRVVPGSPGRPMLPIRVTNPETGLSLRSWGLIDTGADDCALPAAYARSLGHNLTAGVSREIGTGNGVTVAYSHTCKIDIFRMEAGGTVSDTEIVYSVDDTPLDFLPNLHCILLGTKNFLNNFILTVNYPRKVFSLRRPR
ncbi:MAG: hypothetical protein P9M08_10540 [Candidatus Erginobacter occultus]|nr:hypothetical protein [Candidatus Erginobacter occultus]